MLEIGVLGVGGDDSNHAGNDRIKGEIIVATFSTLHEDYVNREFPNNRNTPQTLEWIAHPQRDYRFAMLPRKKYRHSAHNLVRVVPRLINIYLEESGFNPKILKIYFDGELEEWGKERLVTGFVGRRGIEKVTVGHFTKKRHNGTLIKRPYCPALVYHADVLAHYLFNLSYSELTQHEKLAFTDKDKK